MHVLPNGKGDILSISDLVQRAHNTAIEKGWWETDRGIPEQLALIHSEVSEALEAYRDALPLEHGTDEKGKPIGFASELADILIRVGDLAGRHQIDLEQAVFDKLEYNKLRPYRHGGKVC